MSVGRKDAFNQNAGNLGDAGLSVPQRTTSKILLGQASFKGKQKKEPQLIIRDRRSESSPSPMYAGRGVGLSASLIFLWMLSCSHSSVTHFVEFT